jgi:hypothetical protein
VEGKKMGTDDAVFRVDLLLLPRWKRANRWVGCPSMKDNPKIFNRPCFTSTKCRRCTDENETDQNHFLEVLDNRRLRWVRQTCLKQQHSKTSTRGC